MRHFDALRLPKRPRQDRGMQRRWSEIERLWLHVIAAQTAALSPLRKTRALGARLASVAAGRRRAATDDRVGVRDSADRR